MPEMTRAELLCTQLLGEELGERLSISPVSPVSQSVRQSVRQSVSQSVRQSVSQERRLQVDTTPAPCSPVPIELNLDPLATRAAVNIPQAPGHRGPGDTRDEKTIRLK